MRNRVDSVFISSVLFTIAPVCLIPNFWANVITKHDRIWLARLDSGDQLATLTRSDLSVVCLAVILIGLIVIWMGYLKRVYWTWAVMFILVWVWAFPLMVMPILGHPRSLSIPEWIYTAIYYPGSARAWAESVLLFLVMVIALFIPVKSFFLSGEGLRPIHELSPKLIGGSVVAVLLIMITLSAWVRLSAYEVSPAELTSWQQFPPPLPPPNPCAKP
ncbi:MAG: hypothetical protein QOF56_3576 [Acidobacteriaceae bacterium]|nr:hypothetical protein [Acidobacteriaceae bacterium]